jgi:hypothetical protein
MAKIERVKSVTLNAVINAIGELHRQEKFNFITAIEIKDVAELVFRNNGISSSFRPLVFADFESDLNQYDLEKISPVELIENLREYFYNLEIGSDASEGVEPMPSNLYRVTVTQKIVQRFDVRADSPEEATREVRGRYPLADTPAGDYEVSFETCLKD